MTLMTSMKQRLDFQKHSLTRAMNRQFREIKMALSLLEKSTRDLSPLSIMKRGYSITLKLPEKRVLRVASEVQKGDQVQVLLAKGELECQIEKVHSDKEW